GGRGRMESFDQMVRIPDADGETDEPVSDAKGATSLGWDRSMARHGRIEGEAVHVAHGRRRGDEFEGVQETEDLGLARAHDVEAEDGAIPTALKEASRETVLRMVWQARVMDPGQRLIVAEPSGDALGVFALLPHAQRERLQTPQREPRVEGADVRADVLLDFEQPRPIDGARDDHAAEHVVVPAEVFRGRVNHEIGAQL